MNKKASCLIIILIAIGVPSSLQAGHKDCQDYCASPSCHQALENYHDNLSGCSNFGYGYIVANQCRLTDGGQLERTLGYQNCIGSGSSMTCYASGQIRCWKASTSSWKVNAWTQECSARTGNQGQLLLPQQRLMIGLTTCDYNDGYSVWISCNYDQSGELSIITTQPY